MELKDIFSKRLRNARLMRGLSMQQLCVMMNDIVSKHPTPMTIQLHPQCLLGIQGILRNWTFLIFKQV